MNKFYNGIMGLVVGDALGVPVEFKKRDTYEITDMTGYGTHNQPPGTWSDDSSLTLATLESIVRLGKIDPADIMKNFSDWLNEGKFTPYSKVFDVGGATQRAIAKYANGTDPLKCGGTSYMNNGNGALMRILPVAFVPHTGIDVLNVESLTHNHVISNSACGIYIEIVEMLLASKDKSYIIKILTDSEGLLLPELSRLSNIHTLKREEIKFKRLEAIAVEMNFTYQYVLELHRNALNDFETTYKNL